MRTETIQLYKFEELPENIQEKVIDEYRNQDYIYEEWWEGMHESFHERLKEIGIECNNFYWDFERGKYFKMDTPRITDEKLFLKSAGFQKQLILCSLEEIDLDWDIGITGFDEQTNEISIDISIDYEDDEITDKIKDIFGEDIEEKLTDYLQNILYGFLKELDNEYSFMGSDEYIRDELINREDEFTKEGKRR